MPYLTPDELPEERDCRALLIPASSDWLAIVSGALTELVAKYNWQQFGSVTVDDAVEAMQAMIDAYYDGCASGCELPGGGSIIRIDDDGHIQELIDGEWTTPEGDYVIPSPEARSGGTSEDQRCLAAANATNVLQQLYESLSESWGANLSEAEAITDFTAILIAAVGFAFAPITAAIAAFMEVVFRLLYTALEYLGADLWDADFTDQMRCFLYECSLNSGGVVTFDWDCFTGKLNSLADEFGLTEVQLRLYLQVTYILYFIGGVDGLNLAGGTTAITSADCEDCDDSWCYTFDLEIDDAGATAYTVNGCTAAWAGGTGWYATAGGGCAPLTGQGALSTINISFASTYIRKVVVVGTTTGRSTGLAYAVAFPAINRGGTPAVHGENSANGDPVGVDITINNTITGITAEFQSNPDSGVVYATGTAILKTVTFYGNGDCPFGDPNCFEP